MQITNYTIHLNSPLIIFLLHDSNYKQEIKPYYIKSKFQTIKRESLLGRKNNNNFYEYTYNRN